MKFSEKLKKVMQDLNLNQKQVREMTGKSKGAISMYLNDKSVPTQETQSDIAVSLGLPADYFADGVTQEPKKVAIKQCDGIESLPIPEAARLLHMNHATVRKGLQQGVFPWGYAVHTSENRWSYFINAKRFAEIEGVVI